MKMIFALPLLALGLAACQTYPVPMAKRPTAIPSPRPTPCPATSCQGDYRAIGTEPFWDLTIGRDLVFTDRGNNIPVAEPTPPVRRGLAGETYQGRRLQVNIVHRRCSDGMSDRSYPDTVNVTVDGRAYRGCGADAAFFAAVDEYGRDRPVGRADLSNTNWRVVAINGQPVPMSGHHFNFMPRPRVGKVRLQRISGGIA